MPDNAKIWIYQSDRHISDEEVIKISGAAREFIDSWTAHSKELKGSFEIRHNLFLIIMIDQDYAQASGCSIDKSMHFIQKMEREFGLNLFERMNVAVRKNNSIVVLKKKEIESMLHDEEINGSTIMFNNLIGTKRELDTEWEIPLDKSWIRSAV